MNAFIDQQENGGNKMASGMSVGNDLREWSDDEIRGFLKSNNISIPLTSSTRTQILRKIQSLLSRVAVEDLAEGNAGDRAEESSITTQTTSQSEAEPTCYYGVAIGDRSENDASELTSPYYSNKKDVLKVLAKLKGSRFKKFSTKEEAAQFSQTDVSSPLNSSFNQAPIADEKANNFVEPKQPQLNRFKALIERGDVEKFAEWVWENPRYLVTSADVPTILFPGPYFNALHVAVTKNQLLVCQELFRIVDSDKFLELVYPKDSPETREMRRNHLVDMYLNRQTGRPGAPMQNRDTPLHIASKNGFEDIVKFLKSFTQIDLTVKDKEGQTPKEVACQRLGSSAEAAKHRMERLIDEPDMCFIPLYRSEDNSTPPCIGHPCVWSDLRPLVRSTSPLEPHYTMTALAGPMSPSQTSEFYKQWRRTPQKSSSTDRRRRDPDRGLEHVGRELAMSQDVAWAEYWEFMDAFCDVGSPEGLALLESYLQQRSTGRGGTPASASHAMRTGRGDVSGSPLLLSVGMQGSPCKRALDCRDSVSGECVKQSLNFEEEPHTRCEVERTKEQLPEDGIVLELGTRLDELKLEESRDEAESVTGGQCVKKEESGSSTATLGQMEATNNGCGGTTSGHDTPALTFCAKEEMLTSSIDPAQADVYTPLSTVQEGNLDFLLGSVPCKADEDVLEAIGETEVDPEQFPLVQSWQKSAGSYSLKERQSWRTPRSSSNQLATLPGGRRHSAQRMPLSPLVYSSSPGTPTSLTARHSTRPSTPSVIGVAITPRRLPMTFNRARSATPNVT